ncbi:hypothetical protein BC962_2182 [Gillisia mitskevichiae]|uniref:NrS-1 polymerase-like helicase domain-containing protein n=1 Tax=Gillisia mitskevichiae TaxID=270921 RepID=A0A495PVW5_9FLAO|nr:DUF5906 domain-containing protein [Gillisia mitskevichiae]RKS53915.1 hypothetical protein BC962_2182 [Gillisia mitskevichiae]
MDGAIRKKLDGKVFNIKYGDKTIFWNEKTKLKDDKVYKEYTLNTPRLRQFIIDSGFRNHENKLICLKNNIANPVSPEVIYNHCYNYIKNLKDPGLEGAYIKQGESILIKNRGLLISLPIIEVPMIRDHQNISYKFYKNAIVEITPNKPFKLIAYKMAPGFIWEKAIKKRDFKVYPDLDEFYDISMFSKFIKNLSNGSDHFVSICSAIGYAIHTYKDERKPICLIINDESQPDEEKPQGGTGKGLIVKAISQIVEKAVYNGKNADFSNNKFAYQNVDETTCVMLIDDACRNFDFESLFSVITDDLPVEKKHQPIKLIPYKISPKFIITTNYTIKGDSSSYKRRRFDIFLKNHYSDTFSPADEFKCEFFHEWDKEEWKLFDHFMLGCLKLYLNKGLISYESKNLRLKMLKNETSSDFYDLMEEKFNILNVSHDYQTLRGELISIYGKKYNFLEINKKRIVEWVMRYAEYKEYFLNKKRGKNGMNFTFIK